MAKKNSKELKKLIYASLFLALGMVLPLLTAQVKEIGDSLLPMHLAVMLCGLVSGAGYGAAVGFIMPFLRSVTFGMPPIYPNAVWMAFELATYGFVIGFLYSKFGKKKLGWLYFSLVSAMLAGRVVWGIVKTLLLMSAGKAFTFETFIVGGFVDALPGIILQLILIPIIMTIINKYERGHGND